MNSFEYNFDQIKTNLFSKLLLDAVQARNGDLLRVNRRDNLYNTAPWG